MGQNIAIVLNENVTIHKIRAVITEISDDIPHCSDIHTGKLGKMISITCRHQNAGVNVMAFFGNYAKNDYGQPGILLTASETTEAKWLLREMVDHLGGYYSGNSGEDFMLIESGKFYEWNPVETTEMKLRSIIEESIWTSPSEKLQGIEHAIQKIMSTFNIK